MQPRLRHIWEQTAALTPLTAHIHLLLSFEFGIEVPARMMKSSLHSEEDDFVPELQRSIHPRERPDWEETLSAMARGADIPDITGELPLRTCGSTASMKVKNVKKYINPGLMGCDAFHRLSFTKGHFPKMAECAHFHYENVDFGNIQVMKIDLLTHLEEINRGDHMRKHLQLDTGKSGQSNSDTALWDCVSQQA
uniref:Uncharacterized protein n=1 Tax=Phasianus colchicus TaxID=9054 RepID=A0A669PSU9_PHACC